MSYRVTKADEAKPYEAAGHYNMLATRLHDAADVGGHITLGLSHFQPGGGAKMAKSPKELLYYIVEGEMTVITDDSIHMSPDQGRESKNTGSTVAKMLVISYLA